MAEQKIILPAREEDMSRNINSNRSHGKWPNGWGYGGLDYLVHIHIVTVLKKMFVERRYSCLGVMEKQKNNMLMARR